MKPILMLFLAVLLTGCGITPEQWNATTASYNEYNSKFPSRDYIEDPIRIEPVTNQDIEWGVVPNTYSNKNNGTVRYMRNTPDGFEYLTCQNLRGNNVYCQ